MDFNIPIFCKYSCIPSFSFNCVTLYCERTIILIVVFVYYFEGYIPNYSLFYFDNNSYLLLTMILSIC